MTVNDKLIQKLIRVQKLLSKKINITYNPSLENLNIVAAIDVSYLGEIAFVVAVVWNINLQETLEILILRDNVSFPYIPTFLAFREAKFIFRAYKNLIIHPELLLIDSHGIIHPRKVGCATHIGVILDIPTIGVAKHGLVGSLELQSEHLAKVIYKNELLGFAILKNGKPKIFISPGNKLDYFQALNIVQKTTVHHLMPEPLYIADKLSKQIKLLFKNSSYFNNPSL